VVWRFKCLAIYDIGKNGMRLRTSSLKETGVPSSLNFGADCITEFWYCRSTFIQLLIVFTVDTCASFVVDVFQSAVNRAHWRHAFNLGVERECKGRWPFFKGSEVRRARVPSQRAKARRFAASFTAVPNPPFPPSPPGFTPDGNRTEFRQANEGGVLEFNK